MNANFDLNFTVAASDPMPARLFFVRFLAICAIAICLSTNLFAGSVQMTFVGVNGAQAFGVYVGPYSGTMDGAPVDLFCVDYSNEVHFGQQWDANLTSVTVGADLSDTRYGAEPDALQLYEEAAWLSLQFASQPVSQYADIQATIWQLFNPGAPTPSSSFWMQQALSNYASVGFADFAIITNTAPVQPSGQVQEFLTQMPHQLQSNTVPEPGTQMLIGLILVAASCGCRRLRKKQ